MVIATPTEDWETFQWQKVCSNLLHPLTIMLQMGFIVVKRGPEEILSPLKFS